MLPTPPAISTNPPGGSTNPTGRPGVVADVAARTGHTQGPGAAPPNYPVPGGAAPHGGPRPHRRPPSRPVGAGDRPTPPHSKRPSERRNDTATPVASTPPPSADSTAATQHTADRRRPDTPPLGARYSRSDTFTATPPRPAPRPASRTRSRRYRLWRHRIPGRTRPPPRGRRPPQPLRPPAPPRRTRSPRRTKFPPADTDGRTSATGSARLNRPAPVPDPSGQNLGPTRGATSTAVVDIFLLAGRE